MIGNDDKAKRPTITQIAARLGVAPSTVSRAFTKPGLLTPETVASVLQIAKELGYVPNQNARALSTGRAQALGIVVSDIANPFFPPFIRSVQHAADEAGMSVFIADSNEDPGREQDLILKLAPQVHGVIVISSRLPSPDLRKIAQSQNIVLINRDVRDTCRILIDTSAAVSKAIEHFTALGHRHLAYVGGPGASWSNTHRRRAVEGYVRSHPLTVDYFDAGPGTYHDAFEISHKVIASGATAVVAFDDVVAHGLMGGFAAHELKVPDDISVVGCDDTLAITTFPPLSTISADLGHAAREAAQVLLNHGTNTPVAPARSVLEGHLVLRGSTSNASAHHPQP